MASLVKKLGSKIDVKVMLFLLRHISVSTRKKTRLIKINVNNKERELQDCNKKRKKA